MLALLAAAATCAVALTTDRAPAQPPTLASAQLLKPCRQQLAVRLDGSPIPGKPVLLKANGAIRLLACRTSTLRLEADGTKAGAVYARLVVSEDGHPLANTQVRGNRLLSIGIPTPGWVLIAFPNDLQDASGDRNLRLSAIILQPNG